MSETPTNQEMLDHSKALYRSVEWKKNSTVSYIATDMSSKTHKINSRSGAACHAALTYCRADTIGIDYVLHSVSTGFGGILPAKEVERYYDYLFNRSPMRHSYLTKDASKVWEDGVAVSCHDVPNAISGMGCKAIRHAWEKPNVVTTMYTLVDEGGFTENEGFFLGFSFNTDPKQGNVVQHTDDGHVTIYSSSIDTCALYNFVNECHPKFRQDDSNRLTMNLKGGYAGVPKYWNKSQTDWASTRYLEYVSKHPSYKFFSNERKEEVNTNPFGLLPELFKQKGGVGKFDPLRDLVKDTYAEARASLGEKKKAA